MLSKGVKSKHKPHTKEPQNTTKATEIITLKKSSVFHHQEEAYTNFEPSDEWIESFQFQFNFIILHNMFIRLHVR